MAPNTILSLGAKIIAKLRSEIEKNSNASKKFGLKKTSSACNEEIMFVMNRNYFCDVKLTVRGDFVSELEQCGVFFWF